jgi:hypothetical protein
MIAFEIYLPTKIVAWRTPQIEVKVKTLLQISSSPCLYSP